MSNPNFSSLVATTLKNYRATLSDNITNHQVLWYQLKERGFVREDEGGTSIVEPLLVERNTTVKSYSGYDIIDTTPQEGITAAEFQWKQVAGSLSISGEEEFKNSGSKTKVISLLQAKTTQLELSMMLELNRMLQGDGTGNGGKDITGLGIAVEDGTVYSIYGGIDSAAFPYWRNQWIGNVQINTTTGPPYRTFIDALRTMYNSCSRGKIKPTVLVSDQFLFEQYEASLVPNERYMDMKLGDAGFMNLMFKMTPWVFDDDMPNASMTLGSDNHQLVMLNADFLKFVLGKGKNFVVTDMQRPENQDAKVSQVLVYGNLTCANRQRQGRMDVDDVSS
jgi:hypothetical protein